MQSQGMLEGDESVGTKGCTVIIHVHLYVHVVPCL